MSALHAHLLARPPNPDWIDPVSALSQKLFLFTVLSHTIRMEHLQFRGFQFRISAQLDRIGAPFGPTLIAVNLSILEACSPSPF